jgi:hypothetical protein
MDAKMSETDADWAEADAASAIDYAAWAVENAKYAVLSAVDARKRRRARSHRQGLTAEPAPRRALRRPRLERRSTSEPRSMDPKKVASVSRPISSPTSPDSP